MTQPCEHANCTRRAQGALAFAFYPPAAVMLHYGSRAPLTRFHTGLRLCFQHVHEVDPVIHLGVRALELVRVVEAQSGTVVDMAATKAVLVRFDDPEYLRLVAEAQQQAAQHEQPADCACIDTCRGGQVINGRTSCGLVCKAWRVAA